MSLRSWAAGCAALLISSVLLAQSERGTVTGTIQDASGAVVPAAKVTLTNTQTGVAFSIPSNDAGEFTVPQLPVGLYSIKVEKEGFRPATINGLVLNASQTVRADAKLEVGSAVQAGGGYSRGLRIAPKGPQSRGHAKTSHRGGPPLRAGGRRANAMPPPARPS